MGRMSIRTGVYSNRFISKLWAERSTFPEYERRGFFQFLYITACSNLEATIAGYLKAVVFTPVFEMKQMERNGYPAREVTTNGETFEVSMQHEWMAIRRIVERTLAEIDSAPIQRLQTHHVTIVGESIQSLIGKSLHSYLEGLVSVRNLLAHGRELYIELVHPMEFAVSFEQHPLENAMKCLKQVGIYMESEYKGVRHKDAREVIYKDHAVMHFWNVAMEIIQLYENRAITEKLHMMGVNNMEALT